MRHNNAHSLAGRHAPELRGRTSYLLEGDGRQGEGRVPGPLGQRVPVTRKHWSDAAVKAGSWEGRGTGLPPVAAEASA